MTTEHPKTNDPALPEPDYPAPRVIPRSAHSISRKNIDTEALKVLHRLRDAGFAAYLVGGGVRDLLVGRTPKDFDISTDAKPGQLHKLFRNSRLIGRRFKLVQVFYRGGKIIEVSTFRRKSEFDLNGEAAVLAADNTYGNPAEDAFRRDLTINGLFYEIENFSVLDYIGGVEDLHRGIIRMIGEPDRRITRDPVRMLRAIRHAARLDFTIEPATWEAILRHCHTLAVCPVSRIRDELFKDLRAGASRPWAALAMDSGIFTVIFPCYQELTAPGGEPRLLLDRLLGVIDRLHGGHGLLADHMLLGLLLLPWALREFDLLGQRDQGKPAHRNAKAIRDRLDEALVPLSVKRATKEAIATLLINLPQFEQHEKNGWPKWLTRKSYFRECEQFYRIYREALGDRPAEAEKVLEVAALPAESTEGPARKRRSGRQRGRPAVIQQGGGIFGLKPQAAPKKQK